MGLLRSRLYVAPGTEVVPMERSLSSVTDKDAKQILASTVADMGRPGGRSEIKVVFCRRDGKWWWRLSFLSLDAVLS